MLRTQHLLAAMVVMCCATPSMAGRPFTTEDAEVIDKQACEVEAYSSYAESRAPARQTGVWAQVNCGLGGGTQFGFGTGQARAGGVTLRGAALAGKTLLYEPSDHGLHITIAYSLGARRAPGTAWKIDSSSVAMVATLPSGTQTHWHANLGVTRDKIEHLSSTTFALAWERSVSDTVTVGAEAYGTDREAARLGVVARWSVLQQLSLDASYAVQTNSLRERQATLGLKYSW